jgi:hypothetical protein
VLKPVILQCIKVDTQAPVNLLQVKEKDLAQQLTLQEHWVCDINKFAHPDSIT